jgi:hypothetical protein
MIGCNGIIDSIKVTAKIYVILDRTRASDIAVKGR